MRRRFAVDDGTARSARVDSEIADCRSKDKRLTRRFRSSLEQLSSSPGDSIPLVCQDWATPRPRIHSSTMTESPLPM